LILRKPLSGISAKLIAPDRAVEIHMTPATLTIIREEHAALSAMLRSIVLLLAEHRRRRTLPDFAALRAMLFFVDEFPEKRHHRKESDLLFPKLRARTPLSRSLLDHLDQDHATGERSIRDLEHALLGFEMMGEARRASFELAAIGYMEFYLAHMALEEREILPLAMRVLTAADWAELDEAFRTNHDPLTGHEPEADYGALFSRIVGLVPAPIGLGAAHDADTAAAPNHHPRSLRERLAMTR
jgi:hemerythrin-like domain-containing protein